MNQGLFRPNSRRRWRVADLSSCRRGLLLWPLVGPSLVATGRSAGREVQSIAISRPVYASPTPGSGLHYRSVGGKLHCELESLATCSPKGSPITASVARTFSGLVGNNSLRRSVLDAGAVSPAGKVGTIRRVGPVWRLVHWTYAGYTASDHRAKAV